MLTANIIFFVSGQASVALEGSTVFCTPVVRESVSEDSAFSEPVAVPVADCNFMQMVVRLLAVEEFEDGDLLLGSAQVFFFPGHLVNLKNDFSRRLYDRLFVIYFRSRISRSNLNQLISMTSEQISYCFQILLFSCFFQLLTEHHNRHFNRIKTESILFIKFLCDTNCRLQVFFFSPQLPAFKKECHCPWVVVKPEIAVVLSGTVANKTCCCIYQLAKIECMVLTKTLLRFFPVF